VIRGTLSIIEITILSVLILATRCANYQDVFVAGNVYFTDETEISHGRVSWQTR